MKREHEFKKKQQQPNKQKKTQTCFDGSGKCKTCKGAQIYHTTIQYEAGHRFTTPQV